MPAMKHMNIFMFKLRCLTNPNYPFKYWLVNRGSSDKRSSR